MENWRGKTLIVKGTGPSGAVAELAEQLSGLLGFSISGIVENRNEAGTSRVYGSKSVKDGDTHEN
jgi:hypothetical protein